MCENCKIDTLVILYVTNEEIDELTKNLIEKHFYFTRMASSGGFFNFPNTSLLIGISKDRLSDLKGLIKKCCRRRKIHVATQTHIDSYLHHSTPGMIEAEFGGAIMHMLAVEHFEQF